MSTEIKIRVNEIIGTKNLTEFMNILISGKIEVEIIEFKNGPTAALEWLLPTGIVIYLTKAYFETFLKEAAKDHYQILKKAISSKIHPKYIDVSGEKVKLVSAGGNSKTSDFFSRTFSISTSLKNGNDEIEVKLLIPENSDQNTVELAFSKFHTFISNNQEEELFSKLVEMDNGRLWTKVLWLNPESQLIELIDVVQSTKNKNISSRFVE